MTTLGSEPMILVSDLSERTRLHWLGIVLVGTASNRNGLGAAVRVTAGGKVQLKQSDGKSGYLSQSTLPLHFGLGGVEDRSRRGRLALGSQASPQRGLREDQVLRIAEPK